jgi:hypothetical protein
MALIPKSTPYTSAKEQVSTTSLFPKKILIVVEESDQSIHTARYVGSLLRDTGRERDLVSCVEAHAS